MLQAEKEVFCLDRKPESGIRRKGVSLTNRTYVCIIKPLSLLFLETGLLNQEQFHKQRRRIFIAKRRTVVSNYLSGDVRERITDLREQNRLTREQLAEAVGISASTQGRIESGKTERIDQDLLIRYADYFGTSVDFLTGQTNFKTRRNYDIEELSLTEDSVKAICSGKLNMEVMNRLIESEDFQKLTGQIYLYFTSAFSGPIAARNETFRLVEKMIIDSGEHTAEEKKEMMSDLDEHHLRRVGDYEYDHKKIHDRFQRVLVGIRKEMEAESPLSPAATKEMTRKIQQELMKKKGAGGMKNSTAEDLTEATMNVLRGKDQLDEELLAKLRPFVLALYQKNEK